MLIWRNVRIPVFVLLLCAGGCAQQNLGVGATVIDCCNRDYSGYSTFDLATETLPAFLRPLVEEEVARALHERGLVRDQGYSDLVVHLSLAQVDMDDAITRDPFQGRLDPGGEIRFVADLHIEMIDRRSGETVWHGVVSRIHDVVPGETMPLERAQAAIGAAFREALSSFSARR